MRNPRDIVTALRQTPRRQWVRMLKGLTDQERREVAQFVTRNRHRKIGDRRLRTDEITTIQEETTR